MKGRAEAVRPALAGGSRIACVNSVGGDPKRIRREEGAGGVVPGVQPPDAGIPAARDGAPRQRAIWYWAGVRRGSLATLMWSMTRATPGTFRTRVIASDR